MRTNDIELAHQQALEILEAKDRILSEAADKLVEICIEAAQAQVKEGTPEFEEVAKKFKDIQYDAESKVMVLMYT